MIDREADRPVYRQLADIIREQIRTGVLKPGDRLPSEQRLADENGVGRDSAGDAIRLLREEGLVSTERPRGSVVRAQPTREPYAVQRGSDIVLRMPTPGERRRFGLADGVPVAVVTHGARTVVLPGDRYVLRTK